MFKLGEKDKAEELLIKLYKKNKYNGALNFYLGVINYDKKKYTKSLHYLDNALVIGYNPWHAKYYIGMIKWNEGRFHEAFIDFMSIVPKSTELKEEALYYAALCKLKMAEIKIDYLKDAAELFKEAMALESGTSFYEESKQYYEEISKEVNVVKEKDYKLFTHNMTFGLSLKDKLNFDSKYADFAYVGSLVPFYTRNIISEIVYHFTGDFPFSFEADKYPSLSRNHLFIIALYFLPIHFLKIGLNYEFYKGEDLQLRQRTIFNSSYEFLQFLSTDIEFEVFGKKEKDISKYSGKAFTLTQLFLLGHLTPFIKYRYEVAENGFPTEEYISDKFLIGLEVNKFIKDLSFLSYLSRTYRRYSEHEINNEYLVDDEFYALLRKHINENMNLYLSYNLKIHSQILDKSKNATASMVASGLKFKF